MTKQDTVDVLIIGSGPAGMSVALYLIQADPRWATRILVVEKAVHPREKLCGGGVTQLGEKMLMMVPSDVEYDTRFIQQYRPDQYRVGSQGPINFKEK